MADLKSMSEDVLHAGLDVGSTTIKLVVTDKDDKLLFSLYQRHLSDVRQTIVDLIKQAAEKFGEQKTTLAITGSGGMSLAEHLNATFVQEVVAGAEAIRYYLPQINVAIELGGEDAKLTFFDASIDQRMNETCAGGTGAFIDQMASFLRTDPTGLNELAKKHKTIYPIAARCGVFAKTDILPLLNEGAAKEDIAASIFQAVVDQTIGGLACGRTIRKQVAFLGGPLYFLSELRERFIKTLNLGPGESICPSNALYYVALGTALHSKKNEAISFAELARKAQEMLQKQTESEIQELPELFADLEQLQLFQKRHEKARLLKVDWPSNGEVFIGFDAGSTTTKAVVIDSEGNLIHSYYGSNQGQPLQSVITALQGIYNMMPKGIKVLKTGVTGYGEGLIKAALNVDIGEVETMAHYKAAAFFEPDVTFIIDVGGQDMKCLSIKNGLVDKLMLNEACSSGCGSFLETFAKTLNLDVTEFSKAALFAEKPVDLGSRCTVFMNSKVKQAQKEGVSVADISAGLSYSVVRNALYKVIRITNSEELGDKVVVQGGTFLNDAVLRAFELSIGREVIRPNIAGLMGAFGAALLAREDYQDNGHLSTLISKEQLEDFHISTQNERCKKCPNRCLLTINTFSDGRSYISGNRCERGAEGYGIPSPINNLVSKAPISAISGLAAKQPKKLPELPNLYKWKLKRLFDFYHPKPLNEAVGVVGLPRTLGFYETYPFWFTFFEYLGLRVELSPPSSKTMLNKAIDTIPSQTVCYPAKLAHGHILALVNKQVDFIFYPCLPFEAKAKYKTDNCYNCPVVATYPEVLRLNIEALKESNTRLLTPFLDLSNKNKLAERLFEELSFLKLFFTDVQKALKLAYKEQEKFHKDIRKAGNEALEYLEKTGRTGVVLAGHPYHLDPEVHHGVPDLITTNGLAVLTEDSISDKVDKELSLRVVDQWIYHSRLYRSAAFVAKKDNLEMVELTSFGCGIDAVVADQVADIIENAGKVYTLLKIDEGENLGAARIRIRSLLAAIKERKRTNKANSSDKKYEYKFTSVNKKELKKTTLIIPQMSPVHWQFLEPVMENTGYTVKILPTVSREAIEVGLRYVNNDACYPAIVSIGQVIHSLQTESYDLANTCVIMSQTGGGCRATNYVALLRRAMEAAGFASVPVIPFGVTKSDETSLAVTPKLLSRLLLGILYGDMLSRLLLSTRPYEQRTGAAQELFDVWSEKAKAAIVNGDKKLFALHMKEMVADFAKIDIQPVVKPKVGLVGEILLNFHPDANNHAVELVEAEGGQAVLPELMDFILYCTYDNVFRADHMSGSKIKKWISLWLINFIEKRRDLMREALKDYPRFGQIKHFNDLVKAGKKVVSLGNQSGEGWCLTADMVAMLESGTSNVLCLQPFGCLPNHITGKGVIKELKRLYNKSNVAAIDYDAGASEVNQLNRIKLLMSVAKDMQAK